MIMNIVNISLKNCLLKVPKNRGNSKHTFLPYKHELIEVKTWLTLFFPWPLYILLTYLLLPRISFTLYLLSKYLLLFFGEKVFCFCCCTRFVPCFFPILITCPFLLLMLLLCLVLFSCIKLSYSSLSLPLGLDSYVQ